MIRSALITALPIHVSDGPARISVYLLRRTVFAKSVNQVQVRKKVEFYAPYL